MNRSDDAAPLTLLTTHPATELSAILHMLITEDEEVLLAEAGSASNTTFEIVYCGVTFILSITEEIDSLVPLKAVFCNIDPVQIRCGLNIGLGGHVAGGERVPAIVQALLGIAQKIGDSSNAVAAIWNPARVVSGFEYFQQAVAEYLGGGAFPVLALVNFKSVSGGVIATTGLATLCGQELSIQCGQMDESDTMRRVVRVVHDMATNGPVIDHVRLDGLEHGETLTLEPVSGTVLLTMTTSSILDA